MNLTKMEFLEKLKNDNEFNLQYGRKHIKSQMALPPCHLLYQFIVRPLTFTERRSLAYDTYPELKMFWDEKHLDDHNVPKFYLDLNMYQRSCDTGLGVPFNIASMSLLLMLFAKVSNMLPGISTWIGGDTHVYVNHIDAVNEQLAREPRKLPTLYIMKDLYNFEDLLSLTLDDFELIEYDPYPKLENPTDLFTGIKKLQIK